MALSIKSGNVMVYYCFDIANTIDIENIQTIFGKKPPEKKIVIERLTPNYVQYLKPPLLVSLGKRKAEKFSFDAEAKIYDFGVVTIRFLMPIPITCPIDRLQALSADLANNKELETIAKDEVNKIKEEISGSIKQHTMEIEQFFEDYIIFEVNEFDRKITPDELLVNHKLDIARALRCEAGNFSMEELLDTVKFHLSYYNDDIVFIDWNAAFIFDEKHTYDVHDVLEHAVIELLELRAYDTVLDKVLDKTYNDILGKQKFSFFPHSKTINYLTEVKMEISEIVERVENSLKLVGDLYLAKVYTVASNRFYHEKWRKNIEKKLKTLEDIYSDMSTRVTNRRLIILEALMALLFIVWFATELAILFFVGK